VAAGRLADGLEREGGGVECGPGAQVLGGDQPCRGQLAGVARAGGN
jgi:hypothetical protein